MPDGLAFSFRPIDLNTAMNEIANLNLSKAVPIETIPTKLVKENSDIFGKKNCNRFQLFHRKWIFSRKPEAC